MKTIVQAVVAASVLAWPVTVFAQQPRGADTAAEQQTLDPESVITDLAPITVTAGARTVTDVVRNFIGDVSAVHERDGQIAAFDDRICAGVIGLPAAQAQVINNRVGLLSEQIGLRAGRPGCDPNVLIIFTDDSDRLTAQIVDSERRTFAYHVRGQERGNQLLDEFKRPGRPVRWWHMTEEDGFGHDGGSRLRAAIETDIYRAILVVDTRRIGRVTLNSLGDYLAMTALSRLSPDADLNGLDTVLNLFNLPPEARPDEMTDWDRAYMSAIYVHDRDTRSGKIAREELTSRMLRRLSDARAPAETAAD